MRAIEIYVNGEKVCTAGVGRGHVTAHVCLSLRPESERTFFGVGGTDLDSGDFIRWLGPVNRSLVPGDEVAVRVVEVEAFDPPERPCQVDAE